MSDIKPKYGTAGQAVTVTLGGLANNALRQSAKIDNSTTLFSDVLVEVDVTSGTTISNAYVMVFLAASVDGGTNFAGGASGVNSAFTGSEDGLELLGTIGMTAVSTLYQKTFNVARAFGFVPQFFSLVFKNVTGSAFAASGNAVSYQGKLDQIA